MKRRRSVFTEGRRELLRFAIVGGLGTLIYIGLVLFLTEHWLLSTVLSATIAFLVVVGINYVLHYFYTFGSIRSHLEASWRFIVTATGGMLINSGFLLLCARQHLILMPLPLWLLIGASMVVTWNYLLSRFWVFTGPMPAER